MKLSASVNALDSTFLSVQNTIRIHHTAFFFSIVLLIIKKSVSCKTSGLTDCTNLFLFLEKGHRFSACLCRLIKIKRERQFWDQNNSHTSKNECNQTHTHPEDPILNYFEARTGSKCIARNGKISLPFSSTHPLSDIMHAGRQSFYLIWISELASEKSEEGKRREQKKRTLPRREYT